MTEWLIRLALVCAGPAVLAVILFNRDVARYYREVFRRRRR